MPAVCHAAHVRVVLCTAYTAGSVSWMPEMVANVLRQLHQRLVRFRRKSTAHAAGAAKFRPAPIADVLPEAHCSGRLFTRCNDFPDMPFRFRAENAVDCQSIIPLKLPGSRRRLFSPDSVQFPVVIPQKCQQALLLPVVHGASPSQNVRIPPHPFGKKPPLLPESVQRILSGVDKCLPNVYNRL